MATLASTIITWVRRIVKTTSDQALPDSLILEYLNRFYLYDMPAQLQLFDLKRQYIFDTIKNVSVYPFPYLEYQEITQPCYCDGMSIGLYTQENNFYQIYPEVVQNVQQVLGDGSTQTFPFTIRATPILRAYTDPLGYLTPYVIVRATSNSDVEMYICDDGNGVLNQTSSDFQTIQVAAIGTVDYDTGVMSVTFNAPPKVDTYVYTSTVPFQAGRPRAALFVDNVIKLLPVPDRPYKMAFSTFITPAEFASTQGSLPFDWMAEFLARGTARKILSDSADTEQIQFYEAFYMEQLCNVLRRTERQYSVNRTSTIFSDQTNSNGYGYNSSGPL